MMKSIPVVLSAVKVIAFTVIVGFCLTLIVNSLRTPVDGPKNEFTTSISDVSGLHEGNDVRMSGVQVGKVESIVLVEGMANVTFTVKSGQSLYDNTKIAVRYQNLVGQRYLELVQPERVGAVLPAGTHIRTEQTVPSFDVSGLFNGFAPLFETIDPKALNTFAENILSVVQGDGSGFGPALKDIERLAAMANDRQQFIRVIIRNLDFVSRSIVGKSQRVGDLVRQIDPITADLDTRADEFHQSSVIANQVVVRGADLLEQLETTYDDVYWPLHDFLFRVSPLTKEMQESLRLVPSLLTGISSSMRGVSTPVKYSCRKGSAGIPGVGSIIVDAQRLVVCR
ncbi:MlaD family protein [Gordonia malaquae]|uniref:MlaD family protein n=1 Tax=Gordonia malaquae TaxID=410332 RepID=UPI0030C785F4